MIWLFVVLAALFPAIAIGAWGKFEVGKDTQVTELVTKMCKKHGAEDKVPQVLEASEDCQKTLDRSGKDAVENFERCTVSLFKDEVLLKEVAVAIRNNDLNGVFKKYCARAPRMAGCTIALLDSIVLCTGAGADMPALYNSVDQVLGYICHNDGERIGIFIQEGGPQCFQRNAEDLNKCSATFFQIEDDTLSSQPERCCKRFDQAAECVVSKLRGCSNATPANMTQALMLQFRQAVPCQDQDHALRIYTGWLLGTTMRTTLE